jgi:hypothetical protein
MFHVHVFKEANCSEHQSLSPDMPVQKMCFIYKNNTMLCEFSNLNQLGLNLNQN